MLYLPDSEYNGLFQLYEKALSGKADLREAGERLIATCPNFPHGHILLWQSYSQAGDAKAAEDALWRGLPNVPLEPWLYLTLSYQRGQADADDVIGKRLMEIACWQLARHEEVPEDLADIIRMAVGSDSPLNFKDPETFKILATRMEIDRKTAEQNDPPEVVERLLPYRLINDLERGSRGAIASEVLEDLRENAERCYPTLHAATLGWARFSIGTRLGISMIAAVLGEIGTPEHIPDLVELAQNSNEPLFIHAHWAAYRLGQRFPERALEMLRAMIPAADTNLRSGIADQFAMLSDPPGLAAAYRELLAGFSRIAKEGDASYVLLSALDALPGWEAADLKKQYLPLLKREDREFVQEALKNDSFVPYLVEKEIEDFTLDDVCLERALKDYESYDEDEEDEAPPQLVRPARPGRNDPCWCGSGKKYKKCHLEADEKGGRQPEPKAAEPPVSKLTSNEVATELVGQMLQSIPRAASQTAFQMYYDGDQKVIDDREQQQLFIQWILFDFRLPDSGRTVAEEFLKRRVHSLSPQARQQVEAWTRMHLALLEVQRVEPGQGAELKDIFSGETYFVHDVTFSREAVQWDCVINRIQLRNGRDELNGNGLTVARNVLQQLLKWIEKERKKSKQSAADFVAANGHRLHRIVREIHEEQFDNLQAVNFEGHTLAIANAVYEVRDEAEVPKVLRGMEEFEEDTGETDAHQFGWLSVEKSEDGSRPAFGHVTIRDGRLTLETNSEQRLRRGRNLLELMLGQALVHLEDHVESFEEAKRKFRERPPEPRADRLPPEVEREVLLQFKQKHYATWPDEPLPALHGKTPREAVRTRDGRKAVKELLRDFENHEQRASKGGGAAFDFSGLQRELGLDE